VWSLCRPDKSASLRSCLIPAMQWLFVAPSRATQFLYRARSGACGTRRGFHRRADHGIGRLAVLAFRHLAHAAPLHEFAQADATEEAVNLVTEVHPQVVGQAAFATVAVGIPTTTGGIDVLVHR